MSFMKHHAIIVTSVMDSMINEIHKEAKMIFDEKLVSEIITSNVNGYKSFFVAPDGSKEEWPESAAGDTKRKLFTDAIEKRNHPDGSNSIKFVEVYYGDQLTGNAEVVTHN